MSKKIRWTDEISKFVKAKGSTGSGNLPATRPPFTWSAPIVDPRKNVNHDFSQILEGAKRPENGSYAPATHHLAETRSMVAQARAAKRKAYK